ncbi:MAG TPA: GNAT family protein [Rhizomicrobium sp.]|jgi:RimJ/RimL family protein N-acetyltransferase|nr:GNAT family protein [Rhizomicrobium sp.]
MSAQAILAPDTASEGASRAIARVSPSGGGVAISPALPDDIGKLFLWLNDAKAALDDMPYRPLDCLAFKDWLDQQAKQRAQVLFIIRTLRPARAIGFVLFKNLNPVFRAAELGVRIGDESDRGKGHGSAGLKLALQYAWDTLNLKRVWLTVLVGNERAIAAYARAGFEQEGVMRQAAFIGGQ